MGLPIKAADTESEVTDGTGEERSEEGGGGGRAETGETGSRGNQERRVMSDGGEEAETAESPRFLPISVIQLTDERPSGVYPD